MVAHFVTSALWWVLSGMTGPPKFNLQLAHLTSRRAVIKLGGPDFA